MSKVNLPNSLTILRIFFVPLLVVVLFTIPTGDGENLFEWVNRVVYQALLPGAVGSLLFALTYMMVCWSVGKWLDYKKIYIRV